LTNLEVSNQPISIGENSLLTASITETDSLAFSYTDNVISFEFAALHYAAPGQNLYAYKLENFDKEWQYIGNRRFISFTSLPAGDYTLRIKAANKDGIWNDDGVTLAITIPPPPWFSWWAFLSYGLLFVLVIGGFIHYRIKKEKQKKRQLEVQNQKLEGLVTERTSELQNEKEKSDKLLYNILPREVAEELKEFGTTTPKRFEQATILFTDFKGFTEAASNMPADQLIKELNEIFQKFDEIIDSYGLEKIKTIGDAYMAAGGVPMESANHALQCVRAARDMLLYIDERNKNSCYCWEMRVGLHSGDVIAGVVGQRKFTYDLWGETVIVASRMESAGVEGKVNISSTTHDLVKEFFDCEYRGKIIAEGKGKVDMYFVNYQQKEIMSQ
jgi:class 3 adenylate cyclase